MSEYKYTISMVALVILLILGSLGYCNMVNNDCAAMGGHVKWIYGKSTTNYLCLSPDGRIIG